MRNNTLAACLDAFRGYGKVLSQTEAPHHWSTVMDIHGTVINIACRSDGVLFVNCAGRTALMTGSVQALRASLPKVLRG
jgi:hypothetical protein